MKLLCLVLLMSVAVLGGCATKRDTTAKASPADHPKLLVTPENILTGKVAAYNVTGRFVVLDFPVGRMPVVDQTMFVYRQGLKVGEVRITGPDRDTNTVGDLISGEAQKGDEVRDR